MVDERSGMGSGARTLEGAGGALHRLSVKVDGAQRLVEGLAEQVREAGERGRAALAQLVVVATQGALALAGDGALPSLVGGCPLGGERRLGSTDDRTRRGRRGLVGGAGHEVGDRAVGGVAEGCEDRHGATGDGVGDHWGVPGREVAAGAAAPRAMMTTST